jgi:monofunctional biosynthetic peptidoglycan transglycosylase
MTLPSAQPSGSENSLPAAKRRWTIGRALRFAALAAILVLIAPYPIAPLYRVVDPVSTPMAWRFLTGQRVERTWAPLSRISPAIPRAVIAAEDGRFCFHRGIDTAELKEAVADAQAGEAARGASTITQQTAKNLFLWGGRSYVRKALEIPLALWLEVVLGKRRILEIYLNIAEWGPDGEFGVEAGARRAFGVGAADVTPGQAALLASVLPNPLRRNAKTPSPALRRIAGIHLRRMGAAEIDRCLRQR